MVGKIRNHELVKVMVLLESRLWPYFSTLLIGRLCNAFFFNAIQAFILKDVIDGGVNRDRWLLGRAVTLALIAFLIGVPLIVGFYYLADRYIKQAMTDVRVKLFSHMSNLPLTHFDQHHSGGLISYLTNDLETMEGVYNSVRDLIRLLTFGVVALGSILLLDWRFVFLSGLLGLFSIGVNTIFVKPLRRLSDLIQQQWGVLTERLVDLLQSLPETKMFQIEPVIHQAYVQQNVAMVTAILHRGWINGLFRATDFLLANARSVGLLVLGLYLHLQGYGVEVGTVAAIIYLQGNADIMFSGISSVLVGLQRSLAGANRVLTLLDTPIESQSPVTSKSDTGAGDTTIISVNDLTFCYVDGVTNAPALHHLDLSITTRQTVALVGGSGGGKSTFLKLLLGFYPLQTGDIRVCSRLINEYTLAQLRTLMAYVPQDAYLFAGTIEENIHYGNPQATKVEIIAAAKAAYAHDFILEQPNGYATIVGERGAKLSGGQRQRIAIARALLKDAPILLLDEATSALDSESERLVQEAVANLMKGRTSLVVAHRLSTVEQANLIYVLDGGRIMEQGQHQDLLRAGGLYQRLYEAQFRGR